ncbi:phage terminase large subunit [Weizmannia sp. CD-2023]|uniref:phage terminase large subunit n=1 Tax=Heyndrickxia TaxID=2837504 RepID=UPI002E1B51F3|nr:phage terminase large subunit [Weizmannia sp. CD-2023]MED4899721.1 phage terminase large subunit [Weizmannia sp. CD-2023]
MILDFDPVIDSLQRKDAIEVMTIKLKQMQKEAQEGEDIDFELFKDYKDTLARLKRIDRSEDDVLYFAYCYFSDDMNPDNDDNLIPNGTSIDDAPAFHRELCNKLNEVSNVTPNKKLLWGAPRGHAKSAYLSNVFPLHQTVFQKRKYILILSESNAMSIKFIEWIGNQLKYNKKLRNDFGEHLSPITKQNERDNQESFLTKHGVLVEASSMGRQLRGKRNGASRPDLVCCDDMESQRNTNTPELREKNLHWFNSVVIPIGDPHKTAIVYMGTTVHANGLLTAVANRPDFESKIFSAIVSPPDRQDLWDEFEDILRDQSNPNRLEDANNFYYENKEEMDKGVETLWKQRWSYKDLMIEKASMTSRAFNSEFLNNPIDEESQIFRLDELEYFDSMELEEAYSRLEFFGAWDIAMGRSNRSDYNAIVILGRDRKTGIIYVVDTWAKKCAAHVALEAVIDKMKQWHPRVFSVETVQAQFDLFRQLRERCMKEKLYYTKLKAVTTNRSHGKKEHRIESLEPLVANGALKFKRSQRLLLEQLEQFPNGEHDDLPDALQMACDLCSLQTRRGWSRKPKGL